MSWTSDQLVLLSFALLLIGVAVSAAFGGNWRRTGYIAVAFMFLADLALWSVAVRAFTLGTVVIRRLLTFDLLGASLTFRIDRISAVFLIVVPFVALAALLYAVEYMNKVHSEHSPRMYYPFALLLMGAIMGVLMSSDLFFLFVFWELMTLTSWVLVWFDREDAAKVRAAWLYFFVTHVAAACILVAALVVFSRSGSFAFHDVTAAVGRIAQTDPLVANVLMALFLIGFVTKAGMFPFGGWLPSAYPAAPAPASAAFAGSMTKLGIYGVIRVTFEFFRTTDLTTGWGAAIAILGTISILVGTLTALREDDAKRVLSFHIVGQIGYMLLGIGTALFFLKSSPLLASLAFVAGLYHVINHACYKSLLFLNVGTAEYWTGTRDLNKLGGLGLVMPVTMAAAVIASLSIAGIPPFSGFVSKWLIYQSSIQGGISVPLFLVLGLIAMFVSLVTLASFMKLLGAVFLGKPTPFWSKVRGEVPVTMRVPQVALAGVCVLLGVVPLLPLVALYGAVRDAIGTAVPGYHTLFGMDVLGIRLGAVGAWNPAYFVILLAACGIGAYALSRAGQAASRQTVSWYGGEEAAPDEVRYRSHGFCLPFKEAFAKVYPTIRLPKTQAAQSVKKALDLDQWLYGPILREGGRVTDRFSKTHMGVPQVYMIWQLAGVVAVLAALFALFR